MAVRKDFRLFLSIVAAFVCACLLYCLIAPREFEANARVALRGAPVSALALDARDGTTPGSFASGPVQLETLANVLRSEQIAWQVITRLKLYDAQAYSRRFSQNFPRFTPADASPAAKEYLLDQFHEDLTVEGIPHTLVLAIRFRSRDAALSAAVVNALIEEYGRLDGNERIRATRSGAERLNEQLLELKQRVNQDDEKLAELQKQYGILSTSEMTVDGRLGESAHNAGVAAVDALDRELVDATAERIAREAEYKTASTRDPEGMLVSNSRSGLSGVAEATLLQQLHTRRSDLEQERARLEVERGPNFPRAVEIRTQMRDLDAQISEADGKLAEHSRIAWITSLERERLVQKSLEKAMAEGLRLSGAGLKYAAMRREANAHREVYMRLMQEAEEAGIAAEIHGSALTVIDYARQPVEPVSPNLLVDLGIASFVSLWIALGVVLGREGVRRRQLEAATLIVGALMLAGAAQGQAPTPSTSGLPTGVARIPQSEELKSIPNAKDAPTVWNSGAQWSGTPPRASQSMQPIDAPITPGDMLEVMEAHTAEMRATVRVSEVGTVVLPLAGEVKVSGMDERTAAQAINAALMERGMLLHPQASVLVTAYAGLDVSVLGEVARPGVYGYGVHHRLLDLISAASGLTQSAGRFAFLTHRNNPAATAVPLDSSETDATMDHNPELLPGDTVQVSRAGLIYVVGDVIRPGAFPIDPAQATTVVRALSLAWGPAQNAALKKAVLIREQPGGRTLTTLNLKRMLRGLDPDIPVRDRDILFVPDSMAKNLLNRSLESVIQSAAGVSIYSGLVYSQRF
jgi:polysaccharide export outer membrane protein